MTADPRSPARPEDVIREALRWPPDAHHIGCESKHTAGAPCDCYAAGSNAAHAALAVLLAEREEAVAFVREFESWATRAEAAEAELGTLRAAGYAFLAKHDHAHGTAAYYDALEALRRHVLASVEPPYATEPATAGDSE